MKPPFITFYTPTYKRPTQLARCLASVGAQTLHDQIEQIVVVDHVGRGVEGMYSQVPLYASAVHGEWVHFLPDDDWLASPTVVEELKAAIEREGTPQPAVVVVRVRKGIFEFPLEPYTGAPISGRIDLCNFVIRGDVWRKAAAAGLYGKRYEGDYDFAWALWQQQYDFAYCPQVFFVEGEPQHGVPEESHPPAEMRV